jgi:hypothetical protein
MFPAVKMTFRACAEASLKTEGYHRVEPIR